MLTVARVSSPAAKRNRFAGFKPESETWVVSDLQSKWHLQTVLLNRDGRHEQGVILRATELWRKLAFQLRPELRLLSTEMAQTIFWDWMEPLNLPWARSPQAVSTLLQQMQMWMSVLAAPDHSEIMAEWFAENQTSFVRWGHWFELCAEIWRRCQDRGWVMTSWLPAVLLNEDLSTLDWPRKMTFDLGTQISQVEGLLIRNLSEHFSIEVLVPEVPWLGLMKNTLRPYTELTQDVLEGDRQWQPSAQDGLSFARFSTQLAEVKDTVSLVRSWLEAGVPANSIAIVAPDIETHWPALNLYFREEGIPAHKAVTAKLGVFTELSAWLATLKTRLNVVSAADLEAHFFCHREREVMPYEEFRVLFSHVYDAKDLRRAHQHFGQQRSAPAERCRLMEFLAWAVSEWPERVSTERLAGVLQILGQEAPPELQLLARQWVSVVEGLLARREVTVEPAHAQGIHCVSVSSADWTEATHAVFLNLAESGLRRLERSPVSVSDAQKIFTDTGLALGNADRQELEFELLWFLQRDWVELQLNFASTDFSGQVLTPSRLWIWTSFVNDDLQLHARSPRITRWDALQKLPLSQLSAMRNWSSERSSNVHSATARDWDLSVNTWRKDLEVRLSASSLEKFWECPFVFAAQRKLKLRDEPQLDLDLDRRTRGQLLHGVAEMLLQEPVRWQWSDEELCELIEAVRHKNQVRMGEDRLWPTVLAQQLKLARQLLTFEREWRTRFPDTETVARELAFSCHWDLEKGEPTAKVTPQTLSGRLDRVDRDRLGRYALIDYKASSAGLTNWSAWIRNHQIQLPLYADLIERGLTPLAGGAVTVANYFVIKDEDRRKGYHQRDEVSGHCEATATHRNWITTAEKQQLFKDVYAEIQSAVKAVTEGRLEPRPLTETNCPQCAWRTLCRAPHLN